MKHYDLVVIGAGSAGLVAARCATQKGLKVAILEKNKFGGDCTHYGCIPSKSLIHSVKMYQATKHLKDRFGLHGLEISGKPDFAKVMEHVDDIVQGIYKDELPEVYEKNGIDVYKDNAGAKFINRYAVQIGNHSLKFDHAIICTGSSPVTIKAEGSHEIEFLNNENFWSLRSLPESILFIGGGAISAEIGQALVRLGSKVIILENHERILKPVDKDVAETMIDLFKKEGITIISAAEIKSFKKEEDTIVVTYTQSKELKEIKVEKVFIATGRKANTDGLDLEKAGIEYSKQGIKTNDYLQTSIDTIYACGDITAPYKFTHTSSYQANIVVDNILGNKNKSDLSVFPWAIFTDPEIAHVGMSETEAREMFGDKITIFRVDATIDRFITDKCTTGFLKVIFDENDIVLGADAIGAHSGEWIQLLTLAIKCRIPAIKFLDIIFIYPTYSKIVKKVFTRYLKSKL